MKKIFTFLCLCLMCIGSAWGESSVLTLSSSNKFATTIPSSLTADNVTWTCTSSTGTGIQNSYQTTYSGQQFGTGSTNLIFYFKAYIPNCTIKNVTITAAAGNTTPTYTISVGEAVWKSGSLSKTATSYSADGSGEGEIVITLDQNKGSKAVYLGKISVEYETTTSTKTLESIAISGEPDKTTYTEGDTFDPSGLTVTGTYDDESTSEITSGITWNYNKEPLAVGTSSIEVTATVNDITSDAYSVAITVDELKDYVTLPFNWDGGASSVFKALEGVTASGLGSDYADNHAPYLIKFDNTNDYIQFKTNEPIGIITIDVKMLGGGNTSSIMVKGSADGTNFTDVTTLSISGSQNDIVKLSTINNLDESYRYVRLAFTKGSNVGVGPITISKAEVVNYWVVKYDVNDGTGTQNEVQVANGESTAAPEVNPTREGYNFAGWTLTKDGDDAVTFPYTPTANITLYAKWSANSYVLTYSQPSEGGRFTVKTSEEAEISSGTKVEYNAQINLVAEPAETYKFCKFTISYDEDKSFTKTSAESSFTMPSSDATITAEFVKKESYTVTFYDKGEVVETKSVYEGATFADVLNIDNPTATTEGFSFKGWSTSQDTENPKFVDGETAIIANTNLFAIYGKGEESNVFAKVTSEPEDWSGDYLIAYENKVFNGKDEASDYVVGEIKDNAIEKLDGMAVITIAAMDGGYSLMVNGGDNDGKYMGGTSGSNTLKFITTQQLNTLSFSNGDVTITSNTSVLRFNTATGDTNDRFRYYKSTSTTYPVVQLYKKQGGSEVEYSLEGPEVFFATITDAKYATLGLPYAVTIPEGVSAYIASAAEGNCINMEALEGVIPANTGVVLYSETPDTYTFAETVADEFDGQNLMVAVTEEGGKQIGGNGTDYVLAIKEDGAVKFYEANEGTIAKYKAYLQMSTAGVKELNINFNGGEANGIRTIISNDNAKTNAIYNLNGQRMNSLQKGLNIVNGKKLFVR